MPPIFVITILYMPLHGQEKSVNRNMKDAEPRKLFSARKNMNFTTEGLIASSLIA